MAFCVYPNGVDPARQIIVKVHKPLIKQSLGGISSLESAQTSGATEQGAFSDGALQDKGASNTDDASLLHDEMPGYDVTNEMERNVDSKSAADTMIPMEEPVVDNGSLGSDRPLVINIKPENDLEVDSNSESRTMSGRPVGFIQQDDSADGRDDAEDMYPVEMPATSGMDLYVRKLETTGSDSESQQPVKRIRVEEETGLV